MPVTTSSFIQRQPFQQMLGVELPPRREKPPAPSAERVVPAPQGGVAKSSFGLLESLCPRELVDRVIKESGREGQRKRQLPPWLVVYALLMRCLSGSMGYGRLMREVATQAPKWRSPAGRSAFGKARMRLGWEVLEKLFWSPRQALGGSPARRRLLLLARSSSGGDRRHHFRAGGQPGAGDRVRRPDRQRRFPAKGRGAPCTSGELDRVRHPGPARSRARRLQKG